MDIDVMQRQLAQLMTYKPMLDAMAEKAASDNDAPLGDEVSDQVVANSTRDVSANTPGTVVTSGEVAAMRERLEQLEASVEAFTHKAEADVDADKTETVNRVHAIIDKLETLVGHHKFLDGKVADDEEDGGTTVENPPQDMAEPT